MRCSVTNVFALLGACLVGAGIAGTAWAATCSSQSACGTVSCGGAQCNCCYLKGAVYECRAGACDGTLSPGPSGLPGDGDDNNP
jgi:hypothetical protein